jgi:PhnB protein
MPRLTGWWSPGGAPDCCCWARPTSQYRGSAPGQCLARIASATRWCGCYYLDWGRWSGLGLGSCRRPNGTVGFNRTNVRLASWCDREVLMATVKPIPDGYPQVTPYLCVDGASAAIEFYGQVFGATERMRMPEPDGKIGHAELQLGESVIMLSDEYPDRGIRGPKTIGGTPVTMSMYVEDVDSVFARAVQAGATALRPVEDQFYGDQRASSRTRSGTAGASPATSRTSRLTRWPSGQRRWAAEATPGHRKRPLEVIGGSWGRLRRGRLPSDIAATTRAGSEHLTSPWPVPLELACGAGADQQTSQIWVPRRCCAAAPLPAPGQEARRRRSVALPSVVLCRHTKDVAR